MITTIRYSVIFQKFPSRVRVAQKNPSSIRVAGTRWGLMWKCFGRQSAPLGPPQGSKGPKRGPKSEKFCLLAVLGPEKASGVVIIKT